MTCAECLSTLATASLRDITPDSPILAHCSTCPDCSRVTTLLRSREYDAANLLNSLPPMSNPITVAEASIDMARRRRLGRIAVMVSGAALAITIAVAAQLTVIPAMNRDEASHSTRLLTELIPLACLSPEQAAEIISPHLRSNGSVYYVPTSGIAAITVRGTRDEVAKSRELIDQFQYTNGAACHGSGPDTRHGEAGVAGTPADVAPVLAGSSPVAAGGTPVAADKTPAAPIKKR